MHAARPVPATSRPVRFTTADCRLDDFESLVDQVTEIGDYPHAVGVLDNVLIYDAVALKVTIASADRRLEVEDELVRALTDGPGVVVFRGAFHSDVVDRATAVFDAIIAAERAAGDRRSDHFAAAGANDRVWNALEKLAVRDPSTFVDYYDNDIVALVSRAWLGPGYQVTSQINVVRPGGRAQEPHRDYHLGFVTDEVAAAYPAHVHQMSPLLTLQGAVAHCDMPVISGPTMYLPYSHRYAPGYLAWRRSEFREFFAHRFVQLPLAKGDAAFFNPAVFHGAGTNLSPDVQRMANLLQVSSAFGRAMETVDRGEVLMAVYPVLRAFASSGRSVDNVIACAADGYPFPTNLDLDANVEGLTPQSQADLVRAALDGSWSDDTFCAAVGAYAARHRTDGLPGRCVARNER